MFYRLKKLLPQTFKLTLVRIYRLLRKNILFLKRKYKAPHIPTNNDGKVYLNLGCGEASAAEFINIDVEPYPNIHHIQDITELSNFADDSVDMVYASHVLEHIPKDKLIKTLQEWRRVLKTGGLLRFAVPNFDALVDIYIRSGKNVELVRDQVLGQNPPFNNHYTLWNIDYAKKVLEKNGFVNSRIWNPHTVEHHNFNDRATRTIKVGDEDILFSLNIEAEKI